MAALAFAALTLQTTAAHSAVVTLFSETFDKIDFTGVGGGDPQRFGVPTNDGQTDGNTATIGSADNDNKWYAARFEQGDNGNPHNDVGAQKFGGSGNSTPVGLIEDDAGLLIRVDTSGYTGIEIKFDWRTFSIRSDSTDRLVFGYFIGDLLGAIATSPTSLLTSATRSFDLRGTGDAWNWDGGDWIEKLRGKPDDSYTTEMFNLAGAEDGEVWIAFWLDNGEGDFGKIDNILVTGTLVPVPAALPLLLSGLLGFGLLRRRRS